MKKTYVGGGLFSEAQIRQRLFEGSLLKEKNVNYYNPIENDEINDKNNKPSAKDIFVGSQNCPTI